MSPTLYVVDDDASVREGLSILFEISGFRVELFQTGQALLARRPSGFGCILLDMRMPDMDGLQVQEALIRQGNTLPILFMSAYGDIPQTVLAIKGGAADFLIKPVDGALLMARVEDVLADYRASYERQQASGRLRSAIALLSARERQILALSAAGMNSSAIAEQLAISPRTVEAHRSHIVAKTGTQSLADLFRLASVCGLSLR